MKKILAATKKTGSGTESRRLGIRNWEPEFPALLEAWRGRGRKNRCAPGKSKMPVLGH
jgi:hypothetical protein